MKIAILAWGSLIWNPGQLRIEIEPDSNGWFEEGPFLPIEFSRISSDGRLTLVIQPGAGEIKTFYAISKYTDLNLAVLDLAVREGSGRNKIGYCYKGGEIHPAKFKLEQNLRMWLDSKEDIDAIIWTNLSSNYKDKLGLQGFSPDDAVQYLKYVAPDVQAKAEEYIRKAPFVVRTPIRTAIEKALGWTPSE